MKIAAFFLCIILAFASCERSNIINKAEWGSIYKKYGIDSASFELREHSKDRVMYYNKAAGNTRYSPASTFKIMACLIALETSVAPDETYIVKYNGKPSGKPDWDKDMDMRQAFISSSEPYFKDLMSKVGIAEIQKYIDTVRYGNKKIGTDATTFWTDGTLLITPDEQVGFMNKLYFDELPFSKRTMRIVRSIMLQETGKKYRAYYKSGTGFTNNRTGMHSWLVGFVEDSSNHPYFFANHFEIKDTTINTKELNLKISKEIFKDFGLDLNE
jgi:beta-lactamase class D